MLVYDIDLQIVHIDKLQRRMVQDLSSHKKLQEY